MQIEVGVEAWRGYINNKVGLIDGSGLAWVEGVGSWGSGVEGQDELPVPIRVCHG